MFSSKVQYQSRRDSEIGVQLSETTSTLTLSIHLTTCMDTK